MKIDQTVENHEDILKVIDNLLSEAGIDRKEFKGKVTFAGNEPIRPTVLKYCSAGAALGAATSIVTALLHQQKTGEGQDIHVDLRKAWAICNKWQDDAADCVTINGRSYLWWQDKFGNGTFEILKTRDNRWICISAPYPSQFLKVTKIFNTGPSHDQLANVAATRTADEWEEMAQMNAAPISKILSQEEFMASEQWPFHVSNPLIHVEKIGDSAPEPLPAGDRPLSGIRCLSMVHVVAAPHAVSLLAQHGADCLNLHPWDWYEQPTFLLTCHNGLRQAAFDPVKDKAKVYKLVQDADIFVENLRPQLAATQGWNATRLAEFRPGIIYGSIKLNAVGPWSQRVGFDNNAAAQTGVFTSTGTPDDPMIPNVGLAIVDLAVGRLLAIGIQAALLRRAREGGSYRVTVSLAQGCTWLLSLGLIPKKDLLDIKSLGPDHQSMKPTTQSGKTAYGDTTTIADQVEMSLTPPRWPDPIAPIPGSSYPEWLPKE